MQSMLQYAGTEGWNHFCQGTAVFAQTRASLELVYTARCACDTRPVRSLQCSQGSQDHMGVSRITAALVGVRVTFVFAGNSSTCPIHRDGEKAVGAYRKKNLPACQCNTWRGHHGICRERGSTCRRQSGTWREQCSTFKKQSGIFCVPRQATNGLCLLLLYLPLYAEVTGKCWSLLRYIRYIHHRRHLWPKCCSAVLRCADHGDIGTQSLQIECAVSWHTLLQLQLIHPWPSLFVHTMHTMCTGYNSHLAQQLILFLEDHDDDDENFLYSADHTSTRSVLQT